jgi:serine/threonine protein kinase
MELCDFGLHDYIDYHNGSRMALPPVVPPTLVNRDCSAILRMHSMWAIGAHIASGLEFMHTYNHVHRDLNPETVHSSRS